MSPEVINLIQTVSLEAIKILGPAIVAAYAGYKAASIQLNLKLVEIDKNNQFRARESVFSHLKERLANIDEQIGKLNANIAEMIGYATGYKKGNSTGDDDEFVKLMGGLMHAGAKGAPLEITVLLNDMRAAGLAESEEFKALSERQQVSLSFPTDPSYEEMKATALELLETYNLLGGCTRLLIQKQMEQVFAPYLQAGK